MDLSSGIFNSGMERPDFLGSSSSSVAAAAQRVNNPNQGLEAGNLLSEGNKKPLLKARRQEDTEIKKLKELYECVKSPDLRYYLMLKLKEFRDGKSKKTQLIIRLQNICFSSSSDVSKEESESDRKRIHDFNTAICRLKDEASLHHFVEGLDFGILETGKPKSIKLWDGVLNDDIKLKAKYLDHLLNIFRGCAYDTYWFLRDSGGDCQLWDHRIPTLCNLMKNGISKSTEKYESLKMFANPSGLTRRHDLESFDAVIAIIFFIEYDKKHGSNRSLPFLKDFKDKIFLANDRALLRVYLTTELGQCNFLNCAEVKEFLDQESRSFKWKVFFQTFVYCDENLQGKLDGLLKEHFEGAAFCFTASDYVDALKDVLIDFKDTASIHHSNERMGKLAVSVAEGLSSNIPSSGFGSTCVIDAIFKLSDFLGGYEAPAVIQAAIQETIKHLDASIIKSCCKDSVASIGMCFDSLSDDTLKHHIREAFLTSNSNIGRLKSSISNIKFFGNKEEAKEDLAGLEVLKSKIDDLEKDEVFDLAKNFLNNRSKEPLMIHAWELVLQDNYSAKKQYLNYLISVFRAKKHPGYWVSLDVTRNDPFYNNWDNLLPHLCAILREGVGYCEGNPEAKEALEWIKNVSRGEKEKCKVIRKNLISFNAAAAMVFCLEYKKVHGVSESLSLENQREGVGVSVPCPDIANNPYAVEVFFEAFIDYTEDYLEATFNDLLEQMIGRSSFFDRLDDIFATLFDIYKKRRQEFDPKQFSERMFILFNRLANKIFEKDPKKLDRSKKADDNAALVGISLFNILQDDKEIKDYNKEHASVMKKVHGWVLDIQRSGGGITRTKKDEVFEAFKNNLKHDKEAKDFLDVKWSELNNSFNKLWETKQYLQATNVLWGIFQDKKLRISDDNMYKLWKSHVKHCLALTDLKDRKNLKKAIKDKGAQKDFVDKNLEVIGCVRKHKDERLNPLTEQLLNWLKAETKKLNGTHIDRLLDIDSALKNLKSKSVDANPSSKKKGNHSKTNKVKKGRSENQTSSKEEEIANINEMLTLFWDKSDYVEVNKFLLQSIKGHNLSIGDFKLFWKAHLDRCLATKGLAEKLTVEGKNAFVDSMLKAVQIAKKYDDPEVRQIFAALLDWVLAELEPAKSKRQEINKASAFFKPAQASKKKKKGSSGTPKTLTNNQPKKTAEEIAKEQETAEEMQAEFARKQAERKAEKEKEALRLEEARRKAEEEARRKAEEEARRKAEEEARRKAEEEARRKAEEEARRKAEEEARRKAEEEEKKRLAGNAEITRQKAEEKARIRREKEEKEEVSEVQETNSSDKGFDVSEDGHVIVVPSDVYAVAQQALGRNDISFADWSTFINHFREGSRHGKGSHINLILNVAKKAKEKLQFPFAFKTFANNKKMKSLNHVPYNIPQAFRSWVAEKNIKFITESEDPKNEAAKDNNDSSGSSSKGSLSRGIVSKVVGAKPLTGKQPRNH